MDLQVHSAGGQTDATEHLLGSCPLESSPEKVLLPGEGEAELVTHERERGVEGKSEHHGTVAHENTIKAQMSQAT